MSISQPISEALISTDHPSTSPSIQSPYHVRSAIFKIEDQDGIAVTVAPDSTKLSIYQGIIDNRANSEIVLDLGSPMSRFFR